MSLKINQFLILLVMFVCTSVYADTVPIENTDNLQEVRKKKKEKATIYLKNGSVIHGILEQNDDIVVIKTRDGNVFAYTKTDIEKIELNTNPPLSNGAYHHFGFGVSHSETEFNGSFKVVNGYQLGSKMYFGLGVGLEGYYNRTYVPLVLEVQYHPFSDWNSQPYIGANFGKLMTQSDESNGWLQGVQIGFSHPLGNKVSICTAVGYRHGVIVRNNNYYDWWSQNNIERYRKYEINRVEFSLGFMIK